MIVQYDPAVELLTFDFFGWLVQRVAEGATEVWFDTTALRTDERWRRFLTILWHGPRLAGLSAHSGRKGDPGTPGASRMGRLVAAARRAPLPRLKTVLPPGSTRYTITIRRQRESSYRNSNEDAWRKFADEIGALIIEDYDDKATPLLERVALYAGAELNMGVWSGPMVLCTLTPYPCLAFKVGVGRTELVMNKYGVHRPDNMPWCAPNQTTLWQDDTLDNIRREFERWQLNARRLHMAVGDEVR